MRIVNSSFRPNVRIEDRAIEFVFEDIYLPDSLSNPEGSQGFVSYEIHTQANLVENTRIENTAHIIFDFNPPIITNTTFNTLSDNCGIVSTVDDIFDSIRFYPNPIKKMLFIDDNENRMFEKTIYDIYGKKVLSFTKNKIDQSALASGLYVLKIDNGKSQTAVKIFKE